MDSLLKNTVIIEHPLIAHKVTHLRDVYTGSKEFCELVNEGGPGHGGRAALPVSYRQGRPHRPVP